MNVNSSFRRIGLGVVGLAACVALASCGGKDDGMAPVATPVASNTPPASASASVLGFIAYLKILTPTMPENTQPLDLTGFVAPTDDTGAFDPTI